MRPGDLARVLPCSVNHFEREMNKYRVNNGSGANFAFSVSRSAVTLLQFAICASRSGCRCGCRPPGANVHLFGRLTRNSFSEQEVALTTPCPFDLRDTVVCACECASYVSRMRLVCAANVRFLRRFRAKWPFLRPACAFSGNRPATAFSRSPTVFGTRQQVGVGQVSNLSRIVLGRSTRQNPRRSHQRIRRLRNGQVRNLSHVSLTCRLVKSDNATH